jgi:short-subunit dehydrogenase
VPGFVARGNSTIINISSMAAISPETLNGVYGATKAFVLTFTHSLVHELADKGIRVQAVVPGATATEFWDITGVPLHRLPAQRVMSADDLVDALDVCGRYKHRRRGQEARAPQLGVETNQGRNVGFIALQGMDIAF